MTFRKHRQPMPCRMVGGESKPRHRAQRVSDSELKELLRPFCVETSTWCAHTKTNLLRLTSDLQSIRMREPQLKVLSLSRLRQRLKLRGAKLGIGLPKAREDLCPMCHCFDKVVFQEYIQKLRDMFAELGQDYWKDWEYYRDYVDMKPGQRRKKDPFADHTLLIYLFI